MKFIASRIASGLVALFGFLTVMFFTVQVAVPGDYFTPFRLGLTEAEVDALRAQYGLDQSVFVQYWQWLKALLSGSLGDSTIGTPVSGLLAEAVSRSVFLLVAGLAVAFAVGMAQGRWTAWTRGVRSDVVTAVGLLFLTAFPPSIAFVLNDRARVPLRTLRVKVMGVHIDPWGSDVALTESQVFYQMSISILGVVAVAGLIVMLMGRLTRLRPRAWWVAVLSSVLLGGYWSFQDARWLAVDLLFEAAVPLLAFILLSYGEFLLIMQATTAAVYHEPYVETGRAKGLSERQVRNRHASPNAILPLLARFAVSVPFLMAGLVILERSLGWPGVGTFLFASITSQDLPLVMGALAIIGAMAVVVRVILDVVTVSLDPRIRRP